MRSQPSVYFQTGVGMAPGQLLRKASPPGSTIVEGPADTAFRPMRPILPTDRGFPVAEVVPSTAPLRAEWLLLVSSLLMLASVAASKVASRLGIPTLLLFLAVGMLAGSDGPGGIAFDDPWLSQFLGVSALTLILFAGGLDTDWELVRPVLRPAFVLSTVGVLASAGLVGLFVHGVLRWPPLESLLLGAVVSSTDAAAVFGVLRSRRAALAGKLTPLLELESGTNDPMAVFLTVGLIHLLSRPGAQPLDLVLLFFQQMALGGLLGYALGKAMLWLLNHIKLEFDGLYPVLALALVLFVYAATALLNGSGFLAAYLAGLVLGNSNFVHKRSLVRFFDALAWLMQIVMFVVLGLLVFPSQLPSVALAGLAVAAFLMVVARPVAVFLCLAWERMSWREKALIAWVGLRGAVPIVLATLPRLAGLEQAPIIFNVVFFVVLTSALLQGASIALVSRWLGLAEPASANAKAPLELVPAENMNTDLVELTLPAHSPAVGKQILELGLPPETLIALVRRNNEYLVPTGSTRLQAGDTLLVLCNREGVQKVRQRLQAP